MLAERRVLATLWLANPDGTDHQLSFLLLLSFLSPYEVTAEEVLALCPADVCKA